jgi:hypothetical protein
MKDGFKYFSLLLVAILLIKVSAFHAYEDHDPLEDQGHCELCLIAIEGQQLEGMDPPTVLVPSTSITPFIRPVRRSVQPAHEQRCGVSKLFSRPPPTPRV